MKFKLILLTLLLVAAILVIDIALVNKLFAYTDGSPAACTGSPHDKKTCIGADCHFGEARYEAGWITSDIPSTGYVADSIYNIVLTAKGSKISKRFGFQVSPQDTLGNLAGTMIIVDKEQMKLTDKGKYLTQLPEGVEGNEMKTWKFKWKAPKNNAGLVTFYACFIVSGKPEFTITSWMQCFPNISKY